MSDSIPIPINVKLHLYGPHNLKMETSGGSVEINIDDSSAGSGGMVTQQKMKINSVVLKPVTSSSLGLFSSVEGRGWEAPMPPGVRGDG